MKLAGVQMNIALGDVEGNLCRIIQKLEEAVVRGATLVVFPECTLCGYVFDTREEAFACAQSIPGPATHQLSEVCRRLQCYAVMGMLEADTQDIFNSAVLLGPEGVMAVYRKVHLPLLGVDRFTAYGNGPFTVHSASGARLGINICYDANFPEVARCLALLEADLIVLPTNWVAGAGSECTSQHVVPTRALENRVYYLAVNRVGDERGFTFIGGTKLVGPDGQTLSECSQTEEAMLCADIDVQQSRQKHVVRIPNKHESHRMADRRPEMYELLVKPHGMSPPWRH